VGEACQVINVPANGYLTDDGPYGSGWKCNRGYLAADDRCVAVQLPENAHLDYSGSGWNCDRPYRKQIDRCELP
jgi:hypothetical protein